MNITDFFVSSFLSSLLCLVFSFAFVTLCDICLGKYIKMNAAFARGISFFAGLAILCWFILILSIIGYAVAILLKVVFWLTILGAAIVMIAKRYAPIQIPRLKTDVSLISKVSWVALTIVLICCLVISLAPPTDYDSLDYHLGVPLQILKNGNIAFDKNQLHFRLFGFGEMINLLGLANGCPQLGAVIQITGLFLFTKVLMSIVEEKRQATALMLLLGMPVLLFLLPSQKNQLTGVLCTTICFYAITLYPSAIKGIVLFFVFLCLGFAAGLKYSFIISVSVLLLGLLYQKRHLLFKPEFWLMFLGGFVVLITPLFCFKWVQFGDPISPFLEGKLGSPDQVVLGFRTMLQQYQDTPLRFPVSLLIPSSPGTISTILGIGAIIIIIFIFSSKIYRTERFLIAVLLLGTIVGGQRTSRFFLEPFLWTIPFFLQTPQGPVSKAAIAVGKLQFGILIPFYAFAVFLLGPGIISDKKREALLLKSAAQYAEAKWINDALPGNAVIASDVRSRSFLDHRFFPLEYMVYWLPTDSSQVKMIDHMVYDEYNIQYVILPDDSIYSAFRQRYAGEIITANKEFFKATRNPFNNLPYHVTLYRVKKQEGE